MTRSSPWTSPTPPRPWVVVWWRRGAWGVWGAVAVRVNKSLEFQRVECVRYLSKLNTRHPAHYNFHRSGGKKCPTPACHAYAYASCSAEPGLATLASRAPADMSAESSNPSDESSSEDDEEPEEPEEPEEQESGSGHSSESDAEVGHAVVVRRDSDSLFRCEECFRADSSVHQLYSSFLALKAHVKSAHARGGSE